MFTFKKLWLFLKANTFMKKLILIMFFAFVGVGAFAKSPKIMNNIKTMEVIKLAPILITEPVTKVEINNKKNYPVVLTVTACGHTGTFTWNCSSVSEFFYMYQSIVDVYCGTGPCAN